MILCIKISAQNNTVDIFKPIPTVSYLSTYIDTPVDISTGIPKVELSGFSLPTRNKNVNINIGLSYHSKNAVRFQQSSDVGLGWSLMNTSNVISKAVIGGPDEKNANNPNMNMDIFQFNDVFYFNAFGMSGKFIFRKINNTITVQNLGNSKEKIEFTNSTTKYFDILDFKITDEYGNQYFFNKANNILDRTYNYNHKGAYYLTKVLDARNQEIISIEYAEYSYIEDNHLSYTDYKPKRIISNGYGEINLEYDYFPENRFKSNSTHMSSPYLMRKVEQKDVTGKLIQQIDFEYTGLVYYKYILNFNTAYDTTLLERFTRKNGQGNEIESYSFTYNSTGTERNYGPSPNFGYDVCDSDPEPIREWVDNPKYSTIGTLSKMILPTKGYVKFNFESNQYNASSFYGNSSFNHKEYMYFKPYASYNFNTKINDTFSFNVSPGSTNLPDRRTYVVCFQVVAYHPNPLLDPETTPNITLLFDGEPMQQTADGYGRIMVSGTPGQHTITVTGNTTGEGSFSLFEYTEADGPRNNVSKFGTRIKSIEYYDSEFSAVPSKSKNYFYEKFSDSQATSGGVAPFISFNKSSDFITMYGDKELNKNIIYKNVKEVDADGGYTKYTFFAMDDWYPSYSSSMNYIEDVNNRGLLSNKEIYTATHRKVASENHEYTYENLDVNPFIIEHPTSYVTLTPLFIKKHKITNTTIFPQNRSATTSQETLVNKNDFNVEYSKESNDHGDISETYYSYPYSKQITKLLAKNMYKNIIETKTVLNGETISKTENKYDDPSHLFPTSVLSQNLQTSGMSTELSYDQYDSNGNLLQYTTKDGIVTSVIWGYNSTQPIAKIVGVSYSVANSLATDIVTASNADASDPANEAALISALDAFRKQSALINAQVSTYTYDLFIGITSITQPSGIREIYLYDNAQRLKEIKQQEKDAAGNLIYKTVKEFKYNYKH